MVEQQGHDDAVRILLWAVPRSASTVLTKCMSFVDNMEVWHEPYVSSLINEFGWLGKEDELLELVKPLYEMYPEGKRGNLRLMNTFSYASVKEELESKPKDPSTKFIFVKDMGLSINGHLEFLPQKVPVKHVFLIRHPHRFLTSNRLHIMRLLRKSSYDVSDDLIMRTGKDKIFKMWKHVRENIDPNPVVIDSDQYILAPEKVLPKLFAEVGIKWKDSYLSWDESDDIITTWNCSLEQVFLDKVTHGQVFKRAVESTKFHAVDKPIPKREELHPEIVSLVDKYMPGYEEMAKHTL